MTESTTTTIDTIDRDRAIALLEQAVAERGADYKYDAAEAEAQRAGNPEKGPACAYWHKRPDEPGCIIGLVLHGLGVPAESLQAYDRALSTGITGIRYRVRHEHGIVLTDDALATWVEAQRQQDDGLTWGEALEAAKATRA